MLKQFIMNTNKKIKILNNISFIAPEDVKNAWDTYYSENEELIDELYRKNNFDEIDSKFPEIAFELIQSKLQEIQGNPETLQEYKEELKQKEYFLLKVISKSDFNDLVE